MARMNLNNMETATPGASDTVTAEALYSLGLMYCNGRDVDVDLVTAHKWLNLSAMRGNQQARQLRVELSEEMSSEEIHAAQRMARNWLSLH